MHDMYNDIFPAPYIYPLALPIIRIQKISQAIISIHEHFRSSTSDHLQHSMVSAALSGLYTNTSVNTGWSRKMTHRDLHNSDMKKLISILQSYPSGSARDTQYWNQAKKKIHDLPHHLRSSRISASLSSSGDKDGKVKPGHLCKGHSGLNLALVCDIWDWLRFEFDKGIGYFLYPIILYGGLTPTQEWKARQLEPVLQMWHPDFTTAASAPKGREPIETGEKWKFQQNACPACILSRIGPDRDVVFALLAGMVGRYSSRRIGKRDAIKSTRVRFVRYWLKSFANGDDLVNEAWDLGEEMRRRRRNWRAHMRASRGPGFYGQEKGAGQSSRPLSNQSPSIAFDTSTLGSSSPPSVVATERSSVIGIDISDPFLPSSNFIYSSSSQPLPIPQSAKHASSVYSRTTHGGPVININHPPLPSRQHPQARRPRPFSIASSASVSTLGPESPPIIPGLVPTYTVLNGQAQVHETSNSIHSQQANIEDAYDSERDWQHVSDYDSDEWEQETHDARTNHAALIPDPLRPLVPDMNTERETLREEAMKMPKPDRNSMYASFGRSTYDDSLYRGANGYDVRPPNSPVVEGSGSRLRDMVKRGLKDDESGKRETVQTKWSDLY